jgi:hypothetical protein
MSAVKMVPLLHLITSLQQVVVVAQVVVLLTVEMEALVAVPVQH